ANYKKGSTLFLKGETLSSLMLVIEGVVSIFKHDNKGNEIVIGYFTRYKLLAEPATLRHTPLPSSATFKSDGAILKIDLEKFEALFMSHPHISYGIIRSLLHKIDLLQQNIHFNIASTSSEKILFFYQQNPKLSLDLKQYEIASILGMTAETFSRTVKRLVDKGKLKKVVTGYRATV
ncbi:MAG TPA: Crp/Fnr family transcriptional regulator, partial [Campylobacterales bacterium]|nr:Crp/Fnr family transcriptional regulator [Campylobacterales bacterium]